MHYHDDVDNKTLMNVFRRTIMRGQLTWLASFLLKKMSLSLNIVLVIMMALSLLSLSQAAQAADSWGNDKCASPPVSRITSPLAGAKIGGATAYTITGTASDPSSGILKVRVSTDGGKSWDFASDTSGDNSWSSWSYTWDKKTIQDGSYVLISRAKGKNAQGCVESVGAGNTVIVDSTKPITTASSAGYTFGSMTEMSPVSVTLSASDGAGSGVTSGSPMYCVDTANTCTPNLTYNSAINVTCAAGTSCTQYLRYRSVDYAGNIEAVQSATINQNLPDQQPPSTVASAAGYSFGSWTRTSTVSVMLSASDGAGSGVAPGSPKYCVDNANACTPNLAYSSAINIVCAAGSNCSQYVRYQSVDNAGNSEAIQSAKINQDLLTPIASALQPGGRIGSSTLVSLSCDDGTGSGCSKISYTTDGSTPTASSPGYAGPIAISKTTTVNFLAVDNAGNSSAVQSATYITTYSVTANASAHGNVSCTPTHVDYDSNSVCSITPEAGYHITGVATGPTGSSLVSVGKVESYNIANIKADMTISATFAIDTFTVTPSTGLQGGGISPNTAQTVEYNGTATFTVTPSAGYHVTAVTGCNGNLSGALFTTGLITSNCNVTAEFAVDTFTITTNVGANGSVSCTPTVVPYNSGSICLISPDAGYHPKVTGCNGTLTGNTYSITALQSDCTVLASFENGAPSLPTIVSPLSETETATLTPTLVVNAATDPDGDKVVYNFEVYADKELKTLVASTASENASWTTPVLFDNTMYYWRVQASDGSVNSNWMTTANFFVNTVNDSPSTPGISAPDNNIQVPTLTPSLSITNSTDSDYYDTLTYNFEVATDSQFINIVAASSPSVSQGLGGSTSWTVTPALTENTLYFWRVRAKDSNGATSNFVSASFFTNIANDAPTAPAISSPAVGSKVAIYTPTLVVNNATDPDSQILTYIFEIDTINTFDSQNLQTSGFIAGGSGTTGWTPAALTENATYYWRAKANDGLADGPWMATAKFLVNAVNEAPSVPTLNNPAASAWVTLLTPTLQVNASTDPDGDNLSYDFEVYSDSNLSTLVKSTTGVGSSWVVPVNLADNTRYWWRAQAKDEYGLASGWITASSFFVNDKGINDPPSIALLTPGPADSTNSMSYTITWTASDPDSDPVITLFYDRTGSGFSGTQIATGMHASDPVKSYLWDISSLEAGQYYVYARIDDGTSVVKTYAAGPLTIDRTPPTPVITASAGPYGSISPEGQVNVASGSRPLFTFTPDAGYRVLAITLDGVVTSPYNSNSYTFRPISGDHTLSVTFTPDVYTITPVANPVSNPQGSISPSDSVTVPSGGSQTFTITPKENYTVDSVFDGSQPLGKIFSYTFTNVNINHTFRVYFTPITHVISASPVTNGTMYPPAGDIPVNQGTSKTFTITPIAGYHVANVLVDGVSVGAIPSGAFSYTFSNVMEPHTISATIEPNPSYLITVTAGQNGSISPANQVSALGGTSTVFTILPDPAYRVAAVLVDGTSVGAVTSYTFANIQGNHSISATFTPNVYSITPTAGTNGKILYNGVPAEVITVPAGDSLTYTIMPDTGYQVDKVVVDNVTKGAITTYAFPSISADHSITASFKVLTFAITATAGTNGSISPSSVSVPIGGSQTFAINPAVGFRVSDVLIDGVSVGPVQSYTFTNVIATHTISATFAQNPSSTIVASSGPNGTISPSGSVSVPSGGNQTFTFTPDAGYRVLAVTVDGLPKPLGLGYKFSSVTADHTIIVTFTKDEYTITTEVNPVKNQQGIISPPGTPSGSVSVPNGGSQTFTFTPNAGYTVDRVFVDATDMGTITSYTFTNVNIDHKLRVYFKAITYDITASAGTNGSISPAGITAVNQGTDKTFTITAAAGYHVTELLVNGVPVPGAVNSYTYSYTFANVTSSQTISVKFAQNVLHTITASEGGNGYISPMGIVSVLHGTSKTFYFFSYDDDLPVSANVTVDGVYVGNVLSYTFTNITADHTISATIE